MNYLQQILFTFGMKVGYDYCDISARNASRASFKVINII
jgi:hypothetical protein